LRKIALIVFAAILATFATPASAWGVGGNGTEYSILKVHTEIKGGVPAFAAYFISPSEVILLNNLDKADIQAIQKTLDAAFATGKKVSWATNYSRASRTGYWYDASEYNSNMTFYDISSGDSPFIRIK